MATSIEGKATTGKSDASLGPLVRPLPREWTPEHCFSKLSKVPGCVWLDSNLAGAMDTNSAGEPKLGRYSYMAADPFSRIRVDKANPVALQQIFALSKNLLQAALPGLPPFQGGWVGWFGYELGRCFENIPAARFNEFQLPLALLGLYDTVLSWDHQSGEGWIISQGFPCEGDRRAKHAYRRLKQMQGWLSGNNSRSPAYGSSDVGASRLAPQFATRWSDDWTSNFSSEGYRSAVQNCVDYIHAGDLFQVNLSQRLMSRSKCSAAELYTHLRKVSPAPFSGYADLGRVKVVSSSPERFLQVRDGEIEARPIKGTRPRLTDPTADKGMGELLELSEKDRSENVMIVDLLRNDLSRVSDFDSVQVESLCGLEKYPFVWHLVSVIRSQLQTDLNMFDVVAATFPGGSITGAPKIRAMEVISELEPTVRGPYCGSMGYISFAGDMDLSILIRTVTACDGWWQVPVGGGIVADSEPKLEEQETWHKAEGILRAIDSLKFSD